MFNNDVNVSCMKGLPYPELTDGLFNLTNREIHLSLA